MTKTDRELEASEWDAWAKYSLAIPRPDPEENCQVFRRRHTYESGIAEGLRRAGQEAEAWGWIDEWCTEFNRTARTVRNGHTVGAYLYFGDTVLMQFIVTPEALTKAAAWCRAELGK
jgi:hypothetical protein